MVSFTQSIRFGGVTGSDPQSRHRIEFAPFDVIRHPGLPLDKFAHSQLPYANYVGGRNAHLSHRVCVCVVDVVCGVIIICECMNVFRLMCVHVRIMNE